jgi:hypothetical protein
VIVTEKKGLSTVMLPSVDTPQASPKSANRIVAILIGFSATLCCAYVVFRVVVYNNPKEEISTLRTKSDGQSH